MWFDTHVHFDGLKDAVDPVVRRARDAGVTRMLAIGGSGTANRVALEVARSHAGGVWPVIGLDREQVREDGHATALRDLGDLVRANRSHLVALGEMGLDYHYSADTASEQVRLFIEQLRLAVETGLPVVVHSREADEDTLTCLREYVRNAAGRGDRLGVVHCFTGDATFAGRVLELGFFVSFSGIATFRNAGAIREAMRRTPADRLLIETDSPFLAPEPVRGQSNEPANLPHIAGRLAHERGVALEEFARQTSGNALNLFGISGGV